MNNFQRLQQEDIERYKPEIDQIRSDLDNNMELFRFIGNIVEMYIPRFFDTMVVSSAGGKLKTKAPHELPPPSAGRKGLGAKGPGDLDPGRR